ncbi:MAG: hypothetical protein GY810_22295 [Aureispira sp.]|nr:hypothetical protein [Aureispira sp.]
MEKFILTIALLMAAMSISATTFTVTSTADSGPNTLRQAILNANATPGFDIIAFNIAGNHVHRIQPASQLPNLLDPSGVMIDGYTQPGASEGANPPSTTVLKIELNGSQALYTHGLWLQSSNNVIRGLIINEFDGNGILLEAIPFGTNFNHIYGNFIGTDSLGTTAVGNGQDFLVLWAGVMITPPSPPFGNVISHSNIIERNLISGNYAEGVSIVSSPPGDVYNNTVRANYIGTDITGSLALGNINTGIYLGEATHDNLIDSNVISGNGTQGVSMTGMLWQGSTHRVVHHNIVTFNRIGVAANGTSPLPNMLDGVSLGDYDTITYGHAQDNWIHANIIANNGANGVEVTRLTIGPISQSYTYGNKITSNSIYKNAGLGIDIEDDGVNPNDPADQDAGANDRFNFPTILTATSIAGQTTVAGTVEVGPPGAPHSFLFVELFKVDQDPTNHGEGKTYLGRVHLNPFKNTWTVTVTGLQVGDWITTTLTDSSTSNTSEFSQNFWLKPSAVTATLNQQNVSCFGYVDGSATVTPSGGTGIYFYQWSTGETTATAINMAAGPYHVIVTDNAGNGTVVFVNITEPPILQVQTFPTDPSCPVCIDGAIMAQPQGTTLNCQYQWNTGATTQSITGLAVGVYCVTTTDINGCWTVNCDTLKSVVVGIENIVNKGYKLYPNPANHYIKLT